MEYYTVPEAARRLRVSPSTVWRWIESGRLTAYRVGPRGIRIKPADLETLIEPARKEAVMERDKLLGPPPTPAELARRHAVVARILANRKERVIAPLTSADLLREARREEMGEDDDEG